ncbi:MAG: SurA N-terminal domain-containing protein [Candidatus Midichloria mitochondrii]|nr:SurA N-terminal domain-containing protein [Candidatus Midichloria mitochondrii]
MLAALRKSLNHIITKIFLGLLVLTFILWEVGYILRGSKTYMAFKVGNVEYTKSEWGKFYRAQFDRLGDEYKQVYGINSRELQDLFLKQLINSALLKEEVRRLGISVGDDAVKYEIINNMPGFMRDGRFDKDLLTDFLKKMNISETFFIEKIREELAQKVLVEVISSGNLLNNTLLEQITQALYSKREIEIYQPNIYHFDVKSGPTDDELQKVLETNKELFTVPEKRAVTFFKFNLEDADKVQEKISQEELENFYKERSYLFVLPEKRKFLKMVFADEKQAKLNYDKLTAGGDFVSLAKSLKQEIGLNSQAMSRDGFSEDVANIIFSLRQNEISKPIITPFGWCIFKVVDIVPEFIQPMEVVRKEIGRQITEQRCYDRYLKKIQGIERDITQNIPIEAIAASYGLKLQNATITFDIQKYDEKNILQNRVFLNTAFSIQEGVTSGVISSLPDSESFVVKVNKIEPSYIIVFDQIKDKLAAIWKEGVQKKMAVSVMNSVRERVARGEKFVEPGIKITKKFLSINSNKEFNTEDLLEIFNTPVNQVTRIFEAAPDEQFFVKILSAQRLSDTEIKKAAKQEAAKLNNLQDVILNDYFLHLQKVHKVEVYDISLPNF